MMNIGLIGIGDWGKNYLRILSEIKDANLVKIADLDKQKLDYYGNMYKIPTTTDYKDIINDKSIEAICVVAPLKEHYNIVKDCLEGNKHVLVEKPIATTSQEGEKLVKLAKEKNKLLMVGHIFRFSPAVIKLKEEIKKGTLGKIRFLYGSRVGLMTPRTDCGVITDFALHDFDIFCYLLDGYPEEVTAVGNSYLNHKNEDVGFVTLKFKDNIIANICVSWLTPKKIRETWIVGSEKCAKIDHVSQELLIYSSGIMPDYDSFGSFRFMTRQGDETKPIIDNKEPLKEEILHFMKCVIENKDPLTNGEIGVNILKIVEAAYKSLKEKKTVEI